MLLNETLPYCRGDHYAKRYARYERPGVIIRDQTDDERELREAQALLEHRSLAGHMVVEIGAGVGCFGMLALHRGASGVLAIEPEECRHKVLLRQAKDRSELCPLRAAIGGAIEKKSMQWMVEGCGTTQHEIPHMTLSSLHYVRPTCIKISCGAGLPPIDAFPAGVRIVIVKSRHLSEDHLRRFGLWLPQHKLTHVAVRSQQSNRVWYTWEKGNG